MKRIKKLVSLLLAMVMVLSMGLTVFATGVTPPEDTTPDGTNTVAGKGSFTITINDTTKDYTYKAYQIFSGDLSKEGDTKTLSNIVWGSGVDETKVAAAFPGKTAAEVAATLNGKDFDAEAAQNFAATIAKCLSTTAVESTPTTTGEGENQVVENYKITGLTAGYYLVMNSAVPTVDGDFTRYMMEVVGDVTATPKRGTLEHDKYIVNKEYTMPDGVEGVDYFKVNEAPIGGTVNYSIPVTLPQNFADYKTYYLKFEDTLTKGLTFKPDTVKVMAGTQDITKYFYKDPKVVNGVPTGDTEIEVSILDLKALNTIDGITITASTPIVLYYSAELNVNAAIGTEGNPNYVKVVHSNDPNNSGDGPTTPPENPDKPTPIHPTGETPDKEVITYTTELKITKTNESGAFLPGVEFTLASTDGMKIVLVTEESFTVATDGEYWKLKDGTYTTTAPTTAADETNNEDDYDSTTTKYTKTTTVTPKGEGQTDTTVVGTVQADGTVSFRGLGAGKYILSETKTLAGYNTIDPIEFNIVFTGREFISDNDAIEIGANNTLETFIENQKGSLLPSTGGIGTTIFYVVGAVLAIGAGILLVTKKRMSAR